MSMRTVFSVSRTAAAVGLLALVGVGRQAHAEPRDDARRHYRSGLDAVSQQNFELALEKFQLAQALFPHYSNLWSIGLTYTKLDAHADAIRYMEWAIAEGKRPRPAERMYLANAYVAASRKGDAIALYKGILEDDPSFDAQVEPILLSLERSTAQPEPAVAEAPGAAATSAELERLRAIAAELEALSSQLATRAPTVPDEPAEQGAAPATEPAAAPASPELAEEAFATDAYQRVVVTASRYGQDPIDSPSTVTILTADDIRMSGATNIPDVLRSVVGVDVMSLSAAHPDVSIRGFNREVSNKVLVLIDGRTVYLDLLAAPLWATLPIGLPDIERIEIIRGPGSAVYGANAVTGVINIITKTPGSGESLVHAEGGSPGYGQGNVFLTGATDRTSYRFSAGYNQTGRWATAARVGDSSPLELTAANDNLSQRTVRADGRLDFRFGEKGFASLSGGHAEGDTELYVFGVLGDFAMDFAHSYVRGDLSWGPAHIRSFYTKLKAEPGPWVQYQGGRDLRTTNDSDVFDVEVDFTDEFETGALSHKVAFGGGYRYKAVQWGYLEGGGTPITENHFNAFGQDQVGIGPVDIVASLRVDRHPLVDVSKTISPRGAVVTRVAEDTSLRVTGGTSFRAPSQMESYLDLNQPTDADGVYVETAGNRELLPERAVTAELGLHDESSRYHRADVVAYMNRVSNLIYVQDVEAPADPTYNPTTNGFAAGVTQFGNLTPLYTGVGVEADARIFPVDGIDISANVNVQRVFEDTEGEVVPDGSTSLIKANVAVAYRTPWRVDLSVRNHFVSEQVWRIRDLDDQGQLIVLEQEVPARNIVAARVAARPFAGEDLELSVSAWNLGHMLTGETFREHPTGQPVTSRLAAGATYRF